MASGIRVSIIIPCFNRADRTSECWRALPSSLLEPSAAEFIFINNGSTDETHAFLTGLENNSSVHVIHQAENLGFAKACNQGARQARGDFLVFLNNDIVPLNGWLEPMIGLLADNPTIGIVGSKLLYPDGRVQHAGIVVRERIEGKTQLVCHHVHRLSQGDASWVNLEREYQAVTGACLAVRRDVFNRLGGFDEAFFNGYEDLDLCFRAREAGLRIVYCPRSVLVHHESSSQGRFLRDDANTVLFSQRWGNRIASDEAEAYASVARPDVDEIRSELELLRASFEKIRAIRRGGEDDGESGWKSSLRRAILRWLGIAKTQRQMASDIRAIRNAMIHLRRVTERMAMLLDHHDMKPDAARKDQPPPDPHRENKSI